MKILSTNEIEFFNVYNVAHEFKQIIEDNYNSDVIKVTNHLPGIPFFVNGFFAIELYLKAILKYDKRTYSNTHNLYKLFKTFTFTRKNSMMEKCVNIDKFLKINANAFDVWRYNFDNKSTDFKLWGNYGEIQYFLDELDIECQKIKEVINND